MRKNDIIFLFSIFFLIILMLFFVEHCRKKGDFVEITSDGKVYAELPLDKDTQISVKGRNTVIIKDRKAYVSFADCPDKICIKQGEIGEKGGTIVCLPNKMTVKIKNGDK